ncbi:MAG: hypothetical protein ACI8TQ_002533 [Planctomycetota bacterium]|jgi:hypothetical protein
MLRSKFFVNLKSSGLLTLLALLVFAAPDFAQGRQKAKIGLGRDKAKKEAKPEEVEAPVFIPGLFATLNSTPKAVEVGEPMTWELEIHHPRELVPILPSMDLGLGPHWVVLEELGVVAEASPDQIDELGFWITRKRWVVMCLATSQKLPSMEIFFGEGEGALSVLTSENELAVKTVLGLGDQFPRGAKGFRDVEGSLESESPPWWIIGAGVTGLLVIGWWLIGRKRGTGVAEVKAAPLDQLASIEQALPDDLQALQALHYRLTALVREAADQRLGQSNSGSTDGEWLEQIRGGNGIGSEVEQHLAKVIEAAETVKYAGVRPSKYAIEETLKAARDALEGLQSSGGAR